MINKKKFAGLLLAAILIGIAFVMAAWPDNLNTNLISYYKLDANASDSHGSNDGTEVGSITYGGGIIGNGVNLTGISNYINITDVSVFNFTKATNFSISGWFHMQDGPDGQTLFSKINVNRGLQVYKDSTEKVQFKFCNTATTNCVQLVTVETMPTNVWFHLVVIYNGTLNATGGVNASQVRIYVNGTQFTNSLTTNNFIGDPTNNLSFHIGADPQAGSGAPWFNGSIDEFSVWNRELSAAEVAQLYNSKVGITYSPSTVIVNLSSPSTGYTFTTREVSLNCSATDDLMIDNLTLYIDGVKNYTVTDGVDNKTELYTTLTVPSYKSYLWNCLAYDNESNSAWSSSGNSTFTTAEWNLVSETYNTTVTEGSSQAFIINFTYDSANFPNIEAYLYYNNVSYSGTKTGTGNNITFSRSITIPNVAAESNLEFLWNLRLSNVTGTYGFNSTKHNQTVQSIAIDDCSSYSTLIMNLSLRDEKTQASINGTRYNSTIDVDLQLYPIGNVTALSTYSNRFTNNETPQICISNLTNSSYYMSAQIQYGADSYAKEFYNIQNSTIYDGFSVGVLNLYDLDNTSSQEFEITYKDENFLAVPDAIIQVQRKYLSEGLFKTVEAPKTDASGSALAHLELNDVIYTFLIVKNGQLLATFNNVIAVCQTPSLDPCKINLNSFSTSISPDDYTSGDDFTFTIGYTPSTRTVETIYTIPSGTSSVVLMNVTLYDNIGATQACADSLEAASGTLSCAVPTNLGNGTILVEIYKGGVLMSGRNYIKLSQEPEDLYGTSVVFLGLFLTLTLIGIGIGDNPMIIGFFFIVGAGLLIALNLVDTGVGAFIGTGATILWLVIAIVIVMIKGAKRS